MPKGVLMLKHIATLALALLITPLLMAQTPPPAPAPKPPDILENAWNVSVYGAYSKQQTNNGFATGLSLRLSQHLAMRSDVYILNSPQVTVALGGVEYRFSLEHLLKSSTYAANASRVEAFANVEGGTARSTALIGTGPKDLAKPAWSLGGGFDIKLSDTVTVRPLDLKYVRSSFLNNGGQVLGNQLAFSAGLGLRF